MKIRIKNIKYVVIPEAGIVRCYGTFMMQGIVPFINKKWIYELGQIYCRYGTAFKAEGVARCSPEDTFDENIGKKIANMKMRIKIYNKLYKVTVKTDKFIQDMRVTNLKIEDKALADYTHTRNKLQGYFWENMQIRYLFSLQDNGYIKQFRKHWWHKWQQFSRYRGRYKIYKYNELSEHVKLKYPIKPLYKIGQYATYAPNYLCAQKDIKFYIKELEWDIDNPGYVYTLVYHGEDIKVMEDHLYLCKYGISGSIVEFWFIRRNYKR